MGVIVGMALSQDDQTSRVFLPGSSLVRELDLRRNKMGGFEVAKLYVLGLWPVAASGISSAETSGSAASGSI